LAQIGRHRGERKKECVGKKTTAESVSAVGFPYLPGFGNVIYGGCAPGLSCAILTGKFFRARIDYFIEGGQK